LLRFDGHGETKTIDARTGTPGFAGRQLTYFKPGP
jgi:hypothetical protein